MNELIAKYCIICDQIRKEHNGKYFFIGVYNDSLFVEKFPLRTSVQFAFGFEIKSKGDHPFEVWAGIGDQILVEGKAQISGESTSHIIVEFPPVPLKVDKTGELLVKFRLENQKRWKTLATLHVALIKDADPLDLPPAYVSSRQ